MNIIQKLPLMALGLGFGVIIAMSSFKSNKVVDPLYPQVNGIYLSTPLDRSLENQQGGWECISGSAECSAEFSTPPSSTNQTPTGEIKPGEFALIPLP